MLPSLGGRCSWIAFGGQVETRVPIPEGAPRRDEDPWSRPTAQTGRLGITGRQCGSLLSRGEQQPFRSDPSPCSLRP